MGWYGVFLVKKLKIAFVIRGANQDNLHGDFDMLEGFFGKYEKMRGDIEYVKDVSEESKSFSAKTTARMFGIIDTLGSLPEFSDKVFILYFLHRLGLEIDYHPESEAEVGKLRKRGWTMVD